MPKNKKETSRDYSYTQNRELSWLRFNRRILEEAADTSVPLLERLKFLAIFAGNLDEFFMVRVGRLFDLSRRSPNKIDNKSGMTPARQLKSIYSVIPPLIREKERVYAALCAELSAFGIEDVTYEQLLPAEQKYVADYVKTRILPLLSPQIVETCHPAPFLDSRALYVASMLRDKSGRRSVGLLPLPDTLPAFLLLNSNGRFIRTETILLQWAPKLFGTYRVEESCVISATRSADVDKDAETFEDTEQDFRDRMTKILKKRAQLSLVRLETDRVPSREFSDLLSARIPVESHQIYPDRTPLNMHYVHTLATALPKELTARLSYEPYTPKWPTGLHADESMIDQILRRDRLLFFPFDSVDPFLRLLSEAADRRDVLSIRITIYRLAASSKVARALCRAAENGKDVTVMIELRARFDEANNISWSKMLEESGCKIIYGAERYKCHGKLCLITLQNRGRLRTITQIGTGNYNEKTNARYTDLSLMTASDAIGADAAAFFRHMLAGKVKGEYTDLLIAPHSMKPRLMQLIDEEIQKGQDGYICIKANAITARSIIDKLCEASQAGVEVRLIIRGICCIRPGVCGKTENIHVTGIVGRFLEHARIYCFGRSDAARLYISSADPMTRNLRRRVEIACPIHDKTIAARIRYILSTQLADNVKASLVTADGDYLRRRPSQLPPLDSQRVFMSAPSPPTSDETRPAGGFHARLHGAFAKER